VTGRRRLELLEGSAIAAPGRRSRVRARQLVLRHARRRARAHPSVPRAPPGSWRATASSSWRVTRVSSWRRCAPWPGPGRPTPRGTRSRWPSRRAWSWRTSCTSGRTPTRCLQLCCSAAG